MYPVSIREHGQTAVYLACLVLSGPLPETSADSMRPYMLSHAEKRGAILKRVCCLWISCVDNFNMQRIHKARVRLACVLCEWGRPETVRWCMVVSFTLLVCVHKGEQELGVNWNHPTVPIRCQHKLELGCCCGAI